MLRRTRVCRKNVRRSEGLSSLDLSVLPRERFCRVKLGSWADMMSKRMARGRSFLFLGLLAMAMPSSAQRINPEPHLRVDSDHDGLSDGLEQQLLEQFLPKFMIGARDCSVRPAAFRPGLRTPEVESENGTIYGQAFPSKNTGDRAVLAELHYYHLWRTDCGRHGHPLDAEHVAVLIRASDTHLGAAHWKALYWYAAAHEDTVCDVSQIARASTLHAEDHGATIWISPGKHASYLNENLCQRGCGADRCEAMVPLESPALIDLGEPAFAMNAAVFVNSPSWPLREKMARSNFPRVSLARLETLPADDIAWFNPGRHPMQGVIAHSSSTEQALASSGTDTVVAMSVAGNNTGSALGRAEGRTNSALSESGNTTGNAFGKSYGKTRHALAESFRHVGKALRLDATESKQKPE